MFQKTKLVGETVKVNGTEIYHEIRGQGPALLCVPGATGDAETFMRVAECLQDEFTVITYDRRGNSRSPRPAGWVKTSADEQADDAAGLLKELDLAPALVYGNSSGAIIALNLLIRHPEVVRGAILHEPPLLSVLARPEDAMGALRPLVELATVGGAPRQAVEAFLRFVVGDAAFELMDEPWRERLLGNGETLFGIEFGAVESYRPDDATLAAVTMPVQVMAGETSAPFFREAAEWLAARLHRKVMGMPGGHGPHRDRPQAVADTIRPFLRSVYSGSA
jgi:pimeloyl-ACP methyl ester carboxylesterase